MLDNDKGGSSVFKGNGSGLVSHACPKHGLVKRHTTVMLFKDSYYIYSALHFHREKTDCGLLIHKKESTATTNLFGGFMYVYIYIGFI